MKIIKTIAGIMMAMGFILALGTAGSSDIDAISYSQTLVQLAISIGVSLLGYAILRAVDYWEEH